MPGTEKKKAQDRERMQAKRDSEKRFISSVQEAHANYVRALAFREHGGVAAHRMVDAVIFALSNYHDLPSKAQKDRADE